MHTLETLLDEAIEKCQGEAKLARAIGKHRSEISDYKARRRPISPETVALLCDVLQVDGGECRRLVAEALISAPKNQTIAERLRRALFTWGACGVAALVTTTSDAQAKATTCTTDAPFDETPVVERLRSGIHIVAVWAREAARRAVAAFLRGSGYPHQGRDRSGSGSPSASLRPFGF